MSFRIIPAKRINKKKTANGKEALHRLREYLNKDFEEPIEMLCGFWKDQQEAITYQELRQAVQDGEISEETISLWRQDYSVIVSLSLKSLWTNGIVAGSKGQPILDGLSYEFNTQTPGVLNWISERGAAFITTCTEEQTNAISALLTKKMRDCHTVDELSRLIRPCIGLTEGDAKATARYYDNIVATLRKEHPRMKPEGIKRKAIDAAHKYAERKHRERAMTIAQTESAFAYNRGADEGIRQAQANNLLGVVKKLWSTSGDDGVCATCASLEGTELDIDRDFDFKGRILFPGHKLMPPAHPRCACAIEYVEVTKPQNYKLGAEISDEEIPENIYELGNIDIEKTDEAIQYYNEQIRNAEIEKAVAISQHGKVYYSVGDKTSVSLKGIDLKMATVTHNHPISNGIVSFGKDDFEFLKSNQDIRELIAVNEIYTYSVRVLNDISSISYQDMYLKAMEEADIFDSDFDIQNKVFEILNRKGYVKYVRTRIE